MTCEDLLNIEELKSLKLIAGQSGLKRHIRWIYFADPIQYTITENITDVSKEPDIWLKGNELMIITSEAILNNWEFMKQLVCSSPEKKAAGMIIQTGYINDRIKEFADENSIPLFELNWELRLLDLSYIICKIILEEETNNNSLDRIFSGIILNNYGSETDIVRLAAQCHFDLKSECCAAFINTDFSDKISDDNNIPYLQNNQKIQSMIRNCFKSCGIKSIMLSVYDNSINILFPSKGVSDEQIKECFSEICTRFSVVYGVKTKVGIGERYSYVSKIHDSIFEAETAASISEENNIMFYKDMGLLKLLAHIDDKKCLNDYCSEILGKLIEIDGIQKSSLFHTLEVYLENNCIATDAADALFIHRNTLRYRLDRIEEIMNISLEDKKTLAYLYIAFTILKYTNLKK